MPYAAFALFATLAALSLSWYVFLAVRMRGGEGRVPVAGFSLPDLTFALVLAGFFSALAWSAFHSVPQKAETISTRQIWLGETIQLFIVGGVAAFLGFRKMPLASVLGLRRHSAPRAFVYAAGFFLLALPAVMFVAWLISTQLPKSLSEEQQLVSLFRMEVVHRHYSGVATILITATVLAPAMEEFLFRGFFYPIFKRYGGAVASAIITSGLFALLHGSVGALGALFLLALALTTAYEWSGSLLVPICMHALFNSLNLLLLFETAGAAK